MDPEIQPPTPEPCPGPATHSISRVGPVPRPPRPRLRLYHGLRWIFIGDRGLRAGWSVAIFFILFRVIGYAVTIANGIFTFIGKQSEFTACSAFSGELVTFLMVLFAVGDCGA